MNQNRYDFLDILKLASCLLILLHHWAIYVYQPNNNSINFLILFLSKTRYVTAIFFSISGFLFYEKWYYFKKNEHINFKKEFLKVFHSLAPAYYFAIFLSLCAIVFVNFVSSNTTYPLPSFKEWFCNLFMLQDILHETSISAGLWYVIIHLQNEAISLIILKYCRLRFPKK
jgi:peptidoglycan/LPS O-acetylase OafA/YrhL